LDPEVLRGFLRIGVLLGVCGLVMALVQPRDSGEFVLSVCSAAIGGALILGVVILTRWFVRHEQGSEGENGPGGS
jgi:fumarate reductase subunit D